METQTLNDICEYRKGKVPVSDLTVNNYISTENLLPNKGGLVDAISLPAAETTQVVNKDDVLVSNIRPYFKKIWQARDEGGCSNDVLVFIAKPGTDPTFLYYILANDKFFDYSTASSKGTKMPRGDKSAIMQYEVPKLALDDQIKIAQMLRNIDDKIEINEKINRNLSEQQKVLVKDFLDSTNAEIKTLSEISTIKYGKGLPTNILTETGYPVYGGNGTIGFYSEYMYKEPQILISCRGAASGNVWESVPYSFVTSNSLVLELSDYSYFEFLKQYLYMNPLYGYTTGSAQPQITIDNIKNVEVPIPRKEEIENLTENLKTISLEILVLNKENEKLANLRDTLLPKLMSGELDVTDLEI